MPSLFTIAAGIFLFGLTAARDGAQINALTSMASFFENAMYGVLYGYAPEVFPTPHRGTGDAYAAAASRVTGLFAPIIAVYSKVCAARFSREAQCSLQRPISSAHLRHGLADTSN